MKRHIFLHAFAAVLVALASFASGSWAVADETLSNLANEPVGHVEKSDAEWKQQLSPMQYDVLRQKGTERAFTGTLLHNKAKGVYVCAACGNPLFASTSKYDSRTGWPSFWQPIGKRRVVTADDSSFFMTRTELLCGRCGGHLGHVFDDGPPPTHQRYCINSAALRFIAGSE